MSALAIVISKLLSDAAVTAVITAATAIHAIDAPQGAVPPYLIINLVAEPDEQMLGGAGRMYESRVSIECYAATGTAAYRLGETVKTALEDIVKETITVSGVEYPGVDIYKADSDVTDRQDDRNVSRRTIDFYVRWHGAS